MSAGGEIEDGFPTFRYQFEEGIPTFRYLPVPMTPIVLWDLDAWTSTLGPGESYIHDLYDGLFAMMSQNLRACSQNGMLKIEMDNDIIYAIVFSELPWSDDCVKEWVFDMDIFQLPATRGVIDKKWRQLMIVPPPEHYTNTKGGLDKLEEMQLEQVSEVCKDAIIRHLDKDSLNTNVREPIKRALATLANLVTEDEVGEYKGEAMHDFYFRLAIKRFTSEELEGKNLEDMANLCKSLLDHEKRRLMRKFTEMPPSKKRTRTSSSSSSSSSSS